MLQIGDHILGDSRQRQSLGVPQEERPVADVPPAPHHHHVDRHQAAVGDRRHHVDVARGRALDELPRLELVEARDLVAQPGGAPPTDFTATATAADRIVFENPSHDFPRRIIYERSGADRLTASIDDGTERKRIEYRMTRAACDK